ncbi:MAG TPA: hypothetical protein VEL47_05220 [Myxococcota bacterium]|nr:hypothetical protein [Myxococcota bacterium]
MSLRFRNLNRSVLLLAVLVIAVAVVGYLLKKREAPPTSLSQLLSAYGIDTPERKAALELLMRQSGILQPGASFDDLFPKRSHTDDVFKDLLSFIQLTQERFTVRTGKQERWEVERPPWMDANPEALRSALDQLGMIKEVGPRLRDVDVLVILGARFSTMEERLNYASRLYTKSLIKPTQLVLLAGERRVTVGIDGSAEELEAIAKKHGVSDLTETHLIQEAYQASSLFGRLPVDVIDTPRGDLPRPTTETTTLEFVNWLKNHPTFERAVFVSNQPHVKYQQAVISEVLRNQDQVVDFEVVGSASHAHAKIEELVGAFGSTLWAMTPNVVRKAKLIPKDPSLRQAFLQLYAKQPLIYKNVETLLGG